MTQKIIAGRYRIFREIGRGGCAVVYLAMDQRLKKIWAVKEIRRPEGAEGGMLWQRQMSEIRLLKKMNHPAIPRIVDMEESREALYIVMDYIEGHSLEWVRAHCGKQSERAVREWGIQICDVLMYLHSRKPAVIYGDLKLSNLISGPDGKIRLVDFGTAFEKDAGENASGNSAGDAAVLGTPGYAAPEQYRGRCDERSDIYALGIVLDRMAVRKRSPDFRRVIRLCVCRNPSARWQTAAGVCRQLQRNRRLPAGEARAGRIRLRLLGAAAAMFFVTAAGSGICMYRAGKLRRQAYLSLIRNRGDWSVETRTGNCIRAAAMRPSEPAAYLALIGNWEESGEFGRKESDTLLALLYGEGESLDRRDLRVKEFLVRSAMLYLHTYSAGGGTVLADRIQKAWIFLEDWESGGEEEDHWQKMGDRYFRICRFYRDYILNSAGERDPSRQGYQELLRELRRMLDISGTDVYECISACHLVSIVVYDQREALAAVGIEEEEAENLLKKACSLAEDTAASQPAVIKMRSEILSSFHSRMDSLSRAYHSSGREADCADDGIS